MPNLDSHSQLSFVAAGRQFGELSLGEFWTTEIVSGIDMFSVVLLIGTLLVGFIISLIVNSILRKLDQALDSSSVRHAFFSAFDGPLRWMILVASGWLGIQMLLHSREVGDRELETILTASGDQSISAYDAILVCELPFLLWFCFRAVNTITGVWALRAAETEGTYDDQLVPIARTGSKIVVSIIGVVMIIQNLGGDVSSLLAGFGIGGVAVAMAAKDTIANLFGSIVIFVDRPFQVGDWVEIGDEEGTVEEVGLRVTRIRTFANSMITVPNSNLTTTPINNWSRMKKRRIKMTLGLTYDTSPEQMDLALKAIRRVLEEDERICQDFMLVNFSGFGASSLDIFVYAFTKTTHWEEFMRVRQEMMLAWMREIDRLGLGFAFPTQTLHIESLPAGKPLADQPRA